jgi:hypothetical protein
LWSYGGQKTGDNYIMMNSLFVGITGVIQRVEDTLKRSGCTILIGKYERKIHFQGTPRHRWRIILEWDFFFQEHVNDFLLYN